MAKKTVKMNLSSKGYKNFKMAMKKMKFFNEDLFLRYCTLNMVKVIATQAQKKQILEEMKRIKDAEYKKK